jgi:hypothetical protein
LLGFELAIDAVYLALIAVTIRVHNQARQPALTDQAGEGV